MKAINKLASHSLIFSHYCKSLLELAGTLFITNLSTKPEMYMRLVRVMPAKSSFEHTFRPSNIFTSLEVPFIEKKNPFPL